MSVEEQIRDGCAEIRRLAPQYSMESECDEFEQERAAAKCTCIVSDFLEIIGKSDKFTTLAGLAATLSACIPAAVVEETVDALVDLCSSAPPLFFVAFRFMSLLVLADSKGQQRTHRGTLSGSSDLLHHYLDVLDVKLPQKEQTFCGALSSAKLASIIAVVLNTGLQAVLDLANPELGPAMPETYEEQLLTLDSCLSFLMVLVDNCDVPQRARLFRNKRLCNAIADIVQAKPTLWVYCASAVDSEETAPPLSAAEVLSMAKRARSTSLKIINRVATKDCLATLPAPCVESFIRISRGVAVGTSGFSSFERRMARRIGDTILF